MSHQTVSRSPDKLPCVHLIDKEEFRDDYYDICVPLFNASIKGDWEAAEDILRKRPELVGYAISENYDTALHIAASAKSNKCVEKFVENLVDCMTKEQLELQNKNCNTALCVAAAAGNVKIAGTMVNKHEALLYIPGLEGHMPLYLACLVAQSEMVRYLYDKSEKMSRECWTHNDRRCWVLRKCVEADIFDVALQIVTDCEELTEAGTVGVLKILASKTDAFRGREPDFIWRVIRRIFPIIHEKFGPADQMPCDAMKLLRKMWTNIKKLPRDKISTSKVLFVAAEMGNTEFVVELIRKYPDLLWKVNGDNQSIFHVAVSHRHVGIYNLLHEIGSMKHKITILEDKKGNNLLHLVGKKGKTKGHGDVSGDALQMQRELLWFKEVESMMPLYHRKKKNKYHLTPHELFTNEHKELQSAGEKWMKDTASQCMVVAALIATIVFAAAFTVPGGYNQDGMPMFLHKRSLIVFVIADAISLTFSSISILIFLSTHVTSYFEQDFLESLPKILMNGVTTLFISIAAMMFAFSVSFFVLFENNLIWVPIVISLFTSMPVFLFVRLQYKLLADVYHSTYDSKNLFKPGKSKLYL